MITTKIEYACDLCDKIEEVTVPQNPGNVSLLTNRPSNWVIGIGPGNRSYAFCPKCMVPFIAARRESQDRRALIARPKQAEWQEFWKRLDVEYPLARHPTDAAIDAAKARKVKDEHSYLLKCPDCGCTRPDKPATELEQPAKEAPVTAGPMKVADGFIVRSGESGKYFAALYGPACLENEQLVWVCDRDPNKVFPEWLKKELEDWGPISRAEIVRAARDAGVEVFDAQR